MKTAESRFSTRQFGFPSDTLMNLCGWSSEQAPRLSRFTGGLLQRENLNESLIELTNSGRKQERQFFSLPPVVTDHLSHSTENLCVTDQLSLDG